MTANRVIDVERDESGAPLRAIFDSVSESLAVAGEDGVIRLGNRAADANRHSGAKSASVTLSFERGVLRLAIIDDGCGFDPGRQKVNDGKLSLVEARIDP